MDEVNEKFATWLRVERLQAGMSQDKLAAALRARGITMSQSQIAKVERGDRGVEFGLAVAVADIFGTTRDVILGLSPAGSEREQHLAKMLARRETFMRAVSGLVGAELEHTRP